MMTAAIHPEKVRPIMLAGSPLSYWEGIHGRSPMRYLGACWAELAVAAASASRAPARRETQNVRHFPSIARSSCFPVETQHIQ
jgi:pimeloyl-ACP methyl ester carboxylesterase